MITPADLARMLEHADDAAVNHAQNGRDEDVLMYTSQSRPKPVPAPVTPSPSPEPAPQTVNDIIDAAGTIDTAQTVASMVAREAAKATPMSTPTPATVFARVRVTGSDTTPSGQRITTRVETSVTASVTVEPAGGVTVTPMDVAAEAPATSPRIPTPAMMPRKRSSDGPTTFASLDAQELPVVREYSAGGLVFDERGRVAIIARHSRSGHLEWCLPKGHIEKGETPQQTAVREVHEETGILGEVVESIATIDYWFTGTTQRVHKLVHHFALKQIGGDLTVEGDPDHEAEDAIWVDFKDLDDVLSYPNERKIAWLYSRKLNRQANE
ncbi:mutator mutT protein [Bifidobacterium stellenboschense]|uniref:Mutator mutT protein n=2 Tax=Bifidobacterium stellenboschense TaxID=762211 RepID=A0A087E0Y0_9BIFI|nr:NUDIX domain-containing protein [Bifidobacterium stellenboschense]KFJ01431.1 mutator mutT protein [Bifidobacterium stellenboschense]